MKIDDVIYLVAEDPEAHGIFEEHTETPRMVYCQVMSVGRTEYYQAKSNGLDPTFVFRISDEVEYHGEKIVLYHGKRYSVIRAYTITTSEYRKRTADVNAIELTVEEATVDGRNT